MKPMHSIQPFYPLANLKRLATIALALSLALMWLSFSQPEAILAGSPPGHLTGPAEVPEGLSPAEWAQITTQIQQSYYQVGPGAGGETARSPLATDPVTQQAYLKASNTEQKEGFGWSVALSGDTLVVGAPLEASQATGANGNQADNSAPAAGAVHVFTRSGTTWGQQAYLKASNTGAEDGFGWSVALSGDTLVVGAPGVSLAGSPPSHPAGPAELPQGLSPAEWAQITTQIQLGYYRIIRPVVGGYTVRYPLTMNSVAQRAYLKASNAEAHDGFGIPVALSGDTSLTLTDTLASVDIAMPVPVTSTDKIAFESNREILVMNPDGSGLTNLTNSGAWEVDPAWSPDGTRITFASDENQNNWDIYVMNTDGSGRTRLTNSPVAREYGTTWSPDGTRIAFESLEGGNSAIYIMNNDGSQVTGFSNIRDRDPAWSPDGTRIAFSSERNGYFEVYIANIDGSGAIALTAGSSPAWSPDGTRIAFEKDGQIHLINADGNGLISTGLSGSEPAWSPDGKQMAFFAGGNEYYEIFVANTHGSNLLQVTNLGGFNRGPTWSR